MIAHRKLSRWFRINDLRVPFSGFRLYIQVGKDAEEMATEKFAERKKKHWTPYNKYWLFTIKPFYLFVQLTSEHILVKQKRVNSELGGDASLYSKI